MKRITVKTVKGEKKQDDVKKESERGEQGMQGVRDSERVLSFKATLYEYQSNLCRNNGFKGYALHNAAFNKMHKLWKTYIPEK